MEWKGETTTTTRSNTSRPEVPYLPLTVMTSPQLRRLRKTGQQRPGRQNARLNVSGNVPGTETIGSHLHATWLTVESGTANKSHEKPRPLTLRPLRKFPRLLPLLLFRGKCFGGLYRVVEHEIVLSSLTL